MSARIKVSYTDDRDLTRIMHLLSPDVKRWKKQPAKGKYKRAYAELNSERTAREQRESERTILHYLSP